MKFLFFLKILVLSILFLQDVRGVERNSIEVKSRLGQKSVVVDSVFIKYDLNSNFKLDIISFKVNQIFVKPDTNFRAYFFDKFSNLLHFSLPKVVIYPISPGDSLIISSKNNLPYIKIINNKKYSEREVNFVSELSSKNINIFNYYFDRKGRSPENTLRSTVSYADSLASIYELKEVYHTWLKRNAEFSYLELTQDEDIVTSQTDISQNINVDSNLTYRYYQAFLWKRMDRLLKEDYSSIAKIIQVANANFKDACKDYVLYKFAIQHLSLINSEQAKLSISELEGHFIDDEYLSLLKNQYLSKYNVKADHVDQLLQANGESISFEQMIDKYKGKKIYIDVWASWCAPCRAEMQRSRVLKKELEEKNIAFVYLSIDKVQNNWLKANEEEKLGESDSYLITDPLKSRFILKYKIDAIPRYFLLDENGVVLNENAPRPSSNDIKNVLKL